MPRFVKPLLILVPCVILALIVIIGCFDIVPAGYKGVKLTMGATKGSTSSSPLPSGSSMWTRG